MSLSESDNARYLRGKRDAVNEMLLVIGVEPRTSISQSHTVSSYEQLIKLIAQVRR